MRHIDNIKVKLGDLLPSDFREFLGPIDEEDCIALKEDSLDRYQDFWMGLRVYQRDGGYHLVFGHRRIRAMVLKNGPDMELPAKVMEYSDEEKIQLLGEAGWRNATDEERLGLVKLAGAFLLEYNPGDGFSVDIDLLKERVGNGWQNVGATRISNWLGKRLWPRPRIQEIVSPPKPREAVEQIGPKVEPVDFQIGHMDLPDDPNATTNPVAVSSILEGPKPMVNAAAIEQEFFGSEAVSQEPMMPPVRERRVLDPGEVYEKILMSRQSSLEKDFEKLVVQDLKRRYREALLDFIGSINA